MRKLMPGKLRIVIELGIPITARIPFLYSQSPTIFRFFYLCISGRSFIHPSSLIFHPFRFTIQMPNKITAPPRMDAHVTFSPSTMAATIMLASGSMKRNAPVCAADS